jgi:hypothetical protein
LRFFAEHTRSTFLLRPPSVNIYNQVTKLFFTRDRADTLVRSSRPNYPRFNLREFLRNLVARSILNNQLVIFKARRV